MSGTQAERDVLVARVRAKRDEIVQLLADMAEAGEPTDPVLERLKAGMDRFLAEDPGHGPLATFDAGLFDEVRRGVVH